MKPARKRLFIGTKTSPKEREKMIYLAVENECNTLVFSLNDKFFRSKNKKYIKLIMTYALNIEAGGRDLPLLLPPRLFAADRELFRMEHGKRVKKFHFCATNPKTTKIISENAHILFERVLDKVTPPRIFHLFPEKAHENTWCACPACRAFSPAEQYLIAVNSAADALAKLDADARLHYIDYDTEPEAEGISPRKNVIADPVSADNAAI
ncbi:MAG: DUF4838 domain-containing protein [Treponema sp.]|nr:DUF4838 domain-containing protein [Treponema sp.]MCL2251601.1 DUF4838 domain-containing protein [Treponema sp.]